MSTKSAVLALLEKNRGKTISGKFISDQLELTRSAVWKAMEELRKEGYVITAVTNRGYCLSEENNFLSPEGIRPFLLPSYADVPLHVYLLVDSTNQVAKHLALDGALHGTTVLAEQQSGGKGRRGRSFFSPPHAGIYLTTILRLNSHTERALLITAAAAVAVAAAVEESTGISAQIKWVNDIYCNGKKLCGILTEAVTGLESRSIDYVVVGIGVNFSNQKDDFPPELRDSITSISMEGGRGICRNQLAAGIMNHLLSVAENLSSPQLIEEYKRRSCVLGKDILVMAPDSTRQATALDINEEGHLIVKYADGTISSLNSGEITIRPVT